jgi:hypothetical protein
LAFDGRKSWHQSLVWVLEPEDDDTRMVGSNLRINAKLETGSEGSIHSTEIHHRQTIYGNDLAVPEVEWSIAGLLKRLDEAHDRNKSVLRDLLIPTMIERIGLKEKGK